MAESALRVVVDDRIWITDRPVWFSGVRLRVKTTIVRLEDGSLLMHSPAPVGDALRQELLAIGEVRWLVVPNCFHHLGTPAAAASFPNAKVVAPASASKKNDALRADMDIRDARFVAAVPEIEALPLLGVPFLDETVLFHRPTQTLLGADIVLRAEPADHWTWRWAGRVTGCYERLRVPPDVKHKIEDKAAATRSIRAMSKRPARRLIVGHASVVEEDCGERLVEAWRLEGA